MREKHYLIKNMSPWMIEELISLSRIENYNLILLRSTDAFYKKSIEELEENGVKVVNNPFNSFPHLNRVLFTFLFIFKNIQCFFQRYSAVIGVKSIWWFVRLKNEVIQVKSIHAQFATQATILAWMIKEFNKKERRETTFSFTFHAYDIYFNNKWFSKLVNNSESAFSISEYNIDYVNKQYRQLDVSRIILSRLGTPNPPKCTSSNQSKKDGWLYLGFISWFVTKKGLFYLLDAMKILKEKEINVKLILAGDGPLKNKILSVIKENDLQSHIEYIGRINKEEKHTYYCSLDMLVMPAITTPNDQDGIPVVLMEAVSYGLPIIATNVSGIPEICKNNYNGKLIPEKDTEAIANAIIEISESSENRNMYSAGAKKTFEAFNIDVNTKRKAQLMNWTN